jgi:hypothetical protein
MPRRLIRQGILRREGWQTTNPEGTSLGVIIWIENFTNCNMQMRNYKFYIAKMQRNELKQGKT